MSVQEKEQLYGMVEIGEWSSNIQSQTFSSSRNCLKSTFLDHPPLAAGCHSRVRVLSQVSYATWSHNLQSKEGQLPSLSLRPLGWEFSILTHTRAKCKGGRQGNGRNQSP